MALTHKRSIPTLLGQRFQLTGVGAGGSASSDSEKAKGAASTAETDRELVEIAEQQRLLRRVVFDHTQPHLCALGHKPPPELKCPANKTANTNANAANRRDKKWGTF